MSRRTRSNRPKTELANLTSVGPKAAVRESLLNFFEGAACSINHSHSFPVQGDCETSLCLLTILTAHKLACSFLTAELINVKRKNNGGLMVKVSEDKWKEFLSEGCLRSSLFDIGGNNLAEIQNSQILVDDFKRLSSGQKPSKKKI